MIRTDIFYSASVCPCCQSRASRVVAECSDLGLHPASVPVRVNIPLLATSGLKAPRLLEAASGRRGGGAGGGESLSCLSCLSGLVWSRTAMLSDVVVFVFSPAFERLHCKNSKSYREDLSYF